MRSPIKQEIEDLLIVIRDLEFEAVQNTAWRTAVASTLNTILGRASYELETCGDKMDRRLAHAVITIARRTAEFDNIRYKVKPTPALQSHNQTKSTP
jgi:hypothetical protein